MATRNIVLVVAQAKRGISNRWLAKTVGIHELMVGHYRANRFRPKPELAQRIAQVLGVKASTLFPVVRNEK